MMRKLLVLAATAVLAIAPGAIAEPLLDDDTKQVIYNRICSAMKSDYTMKELYNYSGRMIEENGNLEPIRSLHSDRDRIIINHRNTVAIVKQSHSLIKAALRNKNCLPARAFKQ
jgi:hypothetical protein